MKKRKLRKQRERERERELYTLRFPPSHDVLSTISHPFMHHFPTLPPALFFLRVPHLFLSYLLLLLHFCSPPFLSLFFTLFFSLVLIFSFASSSPLFFLSLPFVSAFRFHYHIFSSAPSGLSTFSSLFFLISQFLIVLFYFLLKFPPILLSRFGSFWVFDFFSFLFPHFHFKPWFYFIFDFLLASVLFHFFVPFLFCFLFSIAFFFCLANTSRFLHLVLRFFSRRATLSEDNPASAASAAFSSWNLQIAFALSAQMRIRQRRMFEALVQREFSAFNSSLFFSDTYSFSSNHVLRNFLSFITSEVLTQFLSTFRFCETKYANFFFPFLFMVEFFWWL